jgi:hypothetical protein
MVRMGAGHYAKGSPRPQVQIQSCATRPPPRRTREDAGLSRARAAPGAFGPLLQLVEEIDRAPQVRDHDAAADHQADRERLEHLVAVDAGLLALGHVVADAVVAAQHHRGHQAEQLLGLHVQRAGLVGLGVEREEPAHHLVGLGQDALVHALAELGEGADPLRGSPPSACPLMLHPPRGASNGRPARCSLIMSS